MGDENPIPAWAMRVVMGSDFVAAQLDRLRHRDAEHQSAFEDYVARLLVTVREKALREAARLSKGPFAKAIYALIDKEPGS